jgi:hypothetical protein
VVWLKFANHSFVAQVNGPQHALVRSTGQRPILAGPGNLEIGSFIKVEPHTDPSVAVNFVGLRTRQKVGLLVVSRCARCLLVLPRPPTPGHLDCEPDQR